MLLFCAISLESLCIWIAVFSDTRDVVMVAVDSEEVLRVR